MTRRVGWPSHKPSLDSQLFHAQFGPGADRLCGADTNQVPSFFVAPIGLDKAGGAPTRDEPTFDRNQAVRHGPKDPCLQFRGREPFSIFQAGGHAHGDDMVREAGDPAAKDAAIGNVAIAAIRPFIANIAVADLFQPLFRANTEIPNARGLFPFVHFQGFLNLHSPISLLLLFYWF